MNGPPDTSAYYHAAYIVATVLYAVYICALWRRARRVRSRLERAEQPPV
jgi:hypothetical protein